MFLFPAPRALAQRLPKPQQLDRPGALHRNPATGELGVALLPASPSAAPPIRIAVNLVEVNVGVFAPDGSAVAGLAQRDFRVFENGVEQKIAFFDASGAPLRLALVLDASPSVLRSSDQMKQAAEALVSRLAPQDEVAVVAFSAHTFLKLPFSRDHELLRRAIASIRVPDLFADVGGSNIYQAVFLAAHALFAAAPEEQGPPARRAIVLLTDGQDSGLKLSWDPASMLPHRDAPDRLAFEDVVRELAADGVEVCALSTEPRPRALSPAWLAAHDDAVLISPESRRLDIPPYTIFLAELVRRVGGELYFLHELGALSDAWGRIVAGLHAQYTLGYYPASGLTRPGWRTLRVVLVGYPDARVAHRAAYYVSSVK